MCTSQLQIFLSHVFESVLVYEVHSFEIFNIVVLGSEHFYLRSPAGAKLHVAVITYMYISVHFFFQFFPRLKMLIGVMCSLRFCAMLAICEVVGAGELTSKL